MTSQGSYGVIQNQQKRINLFMHHISYTVCHTIVMRRRCVLYRIIPSHYCDVIMGVISSQITSLTIVYSTVYLSADQRIHESSASLAFVRGIHRWPVNSPHRGSVTRKMFPFDDINMWTYPLLPRTTTLRVHGMGHKLHVFSTDGTTSGQQPQYSHPNVAVNLQVRDTRLM